MKDHYHVIKFCLQKVVYKKKLLTEIWVIHKSIGVLIIDDIRQIMIQHSVGLKKNMIQHSTQNEIFKPAI